MYTRGFIGSIADWVSKSCKFWGFNFSSSKAAAKDMRLKGGVQGLPKASAKQL
jgi:hypothetical protein